MSESALPDFARALINDGPSADYPARMRRFGQLVGTWQVNGTRLNEATGDWSDCSFGWIASHVLDGRGVQAVEVVPSGADSNAADPGPAVSGTVETIATALHVYDPVAGVVRVSYFSPARNRFASLVAFGWRDGIRQDGTQNDGRLVRWNFSSIHAHGYVWDGWVSNDDGGTWVHVEHLEGTRVR